MKKTRSYSKSSKKRSASKKASDGSRLLGTGAASKAAKAVKKAKSTRSRRLQGIMSEIKKGRR